MVRRRRHGQDQHLHPLPAQDLVEVRGVLHTQLSPGVPDLRGVGIQDCHDVEPAAPEVAVLEERGADPASPHQGHTPHPTQAQDAPNLESQVGHLVPESPLAEGTEERQVLPHLGRRRAGGFGQFYAAHRPPSLQIHALEDPEVVGKATNGGVGDLDGHGPTGWISQCL